jgi:hypothetical protein
MEMGKIYGDRYAMKWLPDKDGLTLGIWAIGGLQMGSTHIFSRPRIIAFRCRICRLSLIENDGR